MVRSGIEAAGARRDTGEGRLELVLCNDLAEIERLAAAVERFCRDEALPEDAAFHLNLVLEELVTNIVSYGYEGSDAGSPIAVRLRRDATGVDVEVIDEGRAFDPLSAPEPDLEASVEERPIGGLGVHFLRTLMHDLRYHRAEGRNHLFFRKPLADGGPAA